MNVFDNILLMTDSYKASQYKQYPPNTTHIYSYIESRGGKWDYTVFFGLQMFLKKYLSEPITQEQIDYAAEFWAAHGEPFNREGWEYIVKNHAGRLPVLIKAVPEGTVLKTKNILVSIVNTDPNCYWLTSYLETSLLRAVWYPTTVATNSWSCKQKIKNAMEKSSDDLSQLEFKLQDFGGRGVSSPESAAIGGAAHLVNFKGSDTVEGILAARVYYNEPMAGFSIPASEHSTITSWGKENEVEAYRNMLKQFAKPGSLVAVVSDSYDIYNAIENLWGKVLKEEILAAGATVIIRPDSGDPSIVPILCIEKLGKAFGYTINSKGFKVLNPAVRVIQGDGINDNSLGLILENLLAKGWSADNIAFGMGGGLLQQLDRDTLKFAMKCSAAQINGEWVDVFKDPITDPGKTSKKGRLALISEHGYYETVPHDGNAWRDALENIYKNGKLLKEWTFAEIRERSNRNPR